jgi:hypothetical protein
LQRKATEKSQGFLVFERKKYSARDLPVKKVGDAVGTKHQTGKHPFGENANPSWSENPEVYKDQSCEALEFKEREGNFVREKLTK